MNTIDLKQATLHTCIDEAQGEQVVITRNGKPIAIIVGIEGMDEEQLQLALSGKFWALIAKRRKQGTINRKQLEQKLDSII